MSHASAIERLTALTYYDISRLVECGADNDEAITFIRSVRDNLVDALGDEPRDLESERFEEELRSLAQAAPDVMTYTRMLEAIGTGCHDVSSELTSGETTMVELAGYVLYEQAREIHDKLLEVYKEELLVASETPC
jgi:hypothetical protein